MQPGPPPSRPYQALQGELVSHHSRPMGPRHHLGLSSRAHHGANPDVPTAGPGSFRRRAQPGGHRGDKASPKRSNPQGEPHSKTVPEQALYSSQKGRLLQTSGESPPSESVHIQTAIQNGELDDDQGPSGIQGLDGVHRPKGCFPVDPHPRASSQATSLQVEEESLRIPVPPLWAVKCTKNLHQGDASGDGAPQEQRNSLHHLHRRCPPDLELEAGTRRGNTGDPVAAAAPGIQDKLGEVRPQTMPEDYISGVHRGLFEHDYCATRREVTEHSERLLRCSESAITLSSLSSSDHWQDVSCHTSDPASPPILPKSSAAQEYGISVRPIFRDSGGSEPGGTGGTPMVDRGDLSMEWSSHPDESSQPDHRIRCLPTGVGSPSRGSCNRGPLVSTGKTPPHQCAGVDRRRLCGKDIRKGEERLTCQTEDGQHGSHCVCEPHGGNEITHSGKESETALAVVPREGHCDLSRTPPRGSQHYGRLSVKEPSVIGRVEIETTDIQYDPAKSRPMQCRSVRNTSQCTTEQVHQLETRPVRNCNRCLTSAVVQDGGVCFSPILSDWKMPRKDENRRLIDPPHCTSLAIADVVPNALRDVSGLPTTPTQGPRPPSGSLQPDTPHGGNRHPATSRVEGFRERILAGGVSEQAAKLIAAAWSQGTNTTYQSAWGRWTRWCLQRDLNPFSCGVKPFVNFIASLFQEGLQHRSVNTIRSAVSVTHDRSEGLPLGQHPVVTRIMKGIYNSRPPKPKYTSTWDVTKVTTYLKDLGENRDLTLKQLTTKLVMLMALVQASRSSELAALDIRFRVFRPEGVSFTLPTLTKKRTPGAPPRELFFGGFPPDSRLCIISCLRAYESITEPLRKENVSRLFLSYVKPHKPVTSQRIAHWIKSTLEAAGINTEIFSAHSTRGAATTAALKHGLTIPEILKTADWSTESTFRKFYYRPELDPSFAHKVLTD